MSRKFGLLVGLVLMASPVAAGEMDSEFTSRPAAVSTAKPAIPTMIARATEMDAEGPAQAWRHGGWGGGWRGGWGGGWGGGWRGGWGGGWGRGIGWGGGWGGGLGWGGGWGGGWRTTSFGFGGLGLGYGGLGFGGFGYSQLAYAPPTYVMYPGFSNFGYGFCY